MKLMICIDDTDSKTSEKGTGGIADELKDIVKNEYGGKVTFVTRHQLLIHPDVPYTSHNSSMCFTCEIPDERYDDIYVRCFDHLKAESAEESDPGIAIANLDTLSDVNRDILIDYGKDCKRKVVTKESAYEIAERTGISLREAGGTGQGVIGAVAGVGLRLWGNDGTLKGKPKDIEVECDSTVAELKQSKFIDKVMNIDGEELPDSDVVFVEKKPKISYCKHLLTVICDKKVDGKWFIMDRKIARNYGGDLIFKEGCADFKPDVEEEQIDSTTNNCYNCLYRRWLETGILCQKEN